jgi:exodeoxyribonuclease-3
MKIATWNVNSLRARQGHLLDWLKANPVDAIGLQELKMQDEQFPRAEFEGMGYQAAISGQKAYNGVAILSRHALEDVHRDIPGFTDEHKRVIAATVRGVRIVNLYVPNGQSIGSEKYAYKLRWLAALRDYLREELARHPQLVVTGDFNVAPADADVHDPVAWDGQVLCSEPERAAFHALLELGLQDSFTLFPAPEQRFTWWDYRQGAFRRNRGLRIDHILVSSELSKQCQYFQIDTDTRQLERPSDHAPVTLSLPGCETGFANQPSGPP